MTSQVLQAWTDFASPLWVSTRSSLPTIMIGSTLGALIAWSVVVAERRTVPLRRLAPFAGASLLLLLFYPRQISQASLSYVVSVVGGLKFSQGLWGLVVTNIPTSAGIAYLLFSTMMALVDRFRLPATFIKNSGRAPLLRTFIIATIPLRNSVALVVAVICCTIAFQAALLGRTGSSTIGSQIQKGLSTSTDLPNIERIVLLSTSIAYLVVILGIITLLVILALRVAANLALQTPVPPARGRPPANATLIKYAIGIIVLVAFVVSGLLHAFLILRLFGLAPTVLYAIGLPAGTLESTWPSFVGIGELLSGVIDIAMAGAIVGCALSLGYWFLQVARASERSSDKIVLFGPPCFACLAFLPSTFLGSLALAMPGIGRVMSPLLFLWGALAAAGLTCLLVSHHLLGGRLERFANVRRMRGLGRAFTMFVQEYWLFAVGILLAVLLGNVFDSGYRDQMGLRSLGSVFIDRQGYWDADRRGLALLIMIFAMIAVWALSAHAWRKNEQVRRGQ